MKERSSLFDQGAVLQLLQEEKDKNQLNFFFRQYSKDDKNRYVHVQSIISTGTEHL